MSKVAIVDYGAGNLFSVEQACRSVGLSAVVTSDPQVILSADALILPGVGAFADAMHNLEKLNLVKSLKDFSRTGKPFMGICLGMQLLFSKSSEFGDHAGLNLIDGEVVKFACRNANGEKIKAPQIGWNQIFSPSDSKDIWDSTPLTAVKNGAFMYFVHSFYVLPQTPENVLSITDYQGIEYCSAVIKKNIFAVQFHPEKSGEEGLKIYHSWMKKIKTHKKGI